MGFKDVILQFLSRHPEQRANIGLYNPDKKVLNSIKENIGDIHIILFTANWCPDCREQLPRFFAIMMALEDVNLGLEILEVDRGKKDKLGMAEKLEVMAIPTFIFFRNNVEIGRIIENPEGRFEEDIAEILKVSF